MSDSYKRAGVDISKNDQLIQMLMDKYAERGIDNNANGFSGGTYGSKEFGCPVAHMTTDGIGTKAELLAEFGDYYTAGIDLVAMSLNDLLVDRVEPIGFTDMVSMGRLDLNVVSELLDGILDSLEGTKCDLLAGETAEMPGLYKDGHFSLSGTAMGFRHSLLPPSYSRPGDVLIALPSNGVHANGFSLIRNRLNSSEIQEFHQEYNLLGATKIYYDELKAVFDIESVHGIAHITGGGLVGNLSRITEAGQKAVLYGASSNTEFWRELRYALCVTWEEMNRVFNCGYGIVMACGDESILDHPDLGEAQVIGYIEEN